MENVEKEYLSSVNKRIRKALNERNLAMLDSIVEELQKFMHEKYVSEDAKEIAIRLIEQAERAKSIVMKKSYPYKYVEKTKISFSNFMNKAKNSITSISKNFKEGLKSDFHPSHFSDFDWKSGVIKFAIGMLISFLVFKYFLNNNILFLSAVLFSFSFLFPEKGGFGALHIIIRLASILLAYYPFSFFLVMNSIGKLIGIAILIIGYFIMRTEYSGEKETAGYEFFVFWSSNIIAVLIALQLYMIGTGSLIISKTYSFLGLSLALYALAILIDIPKVKTEEGIVVVLDKKHHHENTLVSLFSWGGYISLLIAVISIKGMMSFSFILTSILGLIFTMSLTQVEDRLSEGIPIFGAIFVMTFLIFSSTMGEAIFGNIWTKVEGTGISHSFKSVGTSIRDSMNDLWLMITCPMCYYKKQLEEQNPSTPQGSSLSIEVKRFEFYSDESVIDPKYSFDGFFDLENMGELTAGWLKVKIETPVMRYREKDVELEDVSKKFTDCPGKLVSNDLCVIDKKIPKGEVYHFEFSFSDWDKQTVDGKYLSKTESMEGEEFYVFGGKRVTLKFDYLFEYSVFSRLDMPVLSESLYKKEIRDYKNEGRSISTYQGGPVIESISVYKHPIKNGDEFSVTFSITNTGEGSVDGASSHIYIPSDFEILDFAGMNKMVCSEVENSKMKGYHEIKCVLTERLTGETGKKKAYVVLSLKANLPEGVEKRTYTFIGNTTYEYEKTIEKTAEIKQFP